MTSWQILTGDVRDMLASLEPQSVQTCVTSPPYFGLRDYGADAQIGLEPSPADYVATMVDVFREVRRVLADDGLLWLNLGDCYAGSWGAQGRPQGNGQMQGRSVTSARQIGAHPRFESCTGTRGKELGLKPKDLMMVPARVAMALQADGWWLRASAPWIKRNGMPESVMDRPTTTIETVFMLAKSESYFYNSDAVMKAGTIPAGTRAAKGSNQRSELKDVNGRPPEYWEYTGTRLRRASDWFFESFEGLVGDESDEPLAFVVNTRPFAGAHFAVFPELLVEPCILAGSKEGDTVLDPFTGSGTTGAVSVRLQRNFVGCELNPAYVELARKRIGDVAPLLAREVA